MEWINNRPSARGYYWYKSSDEETPYIIRVCWGPDLDLANEHAFSENWYFQHIDNQRSYIINILDGKFFGPLEIPPSDIIIENINIDYQQLWQDFFKTSVITAMNQTIPWVTGTINGGHFIRDLKMTTDYASTLADNMLQCYRQRFPKI
jgi:hypothetical protein